jgi:zona occludens toxin
MPINTYTGLMRSGKSYEVVSNVIIPAVLSGRDVVTNVDGISEDRIYDHLVKLNPEADSAKFGKIRHVTNEQVADPEFFPYYGEGREVHTDTVVRPGDLTCIDEAWRFWGTDCKLHKNHKSFFLEHGHFTHPGTGVACDLVCMIQDMGTLHRFVKNVVAFTFRTHKKTLLGMSNTYSVTMWEGHKATKATEAGHWVRRYDKAIFPLYSSFKGGAKGKIVNADSRQNIFASKALWLYVIAFLVLASMSGYYGLRFFKPKPAPVAEPAKSAGAFSSSGSSPAAGSPPPSKQSFSSVWRVVGTVRIGEDSFVVVSDSEGRLRYESPSMFSLAGRQIVGDVDGAKVTAYSGVLPGPRPSHGGGLAPFSEKK